MLQGPPPERREDLGPGHPQALGHGPNPGPGGAPGSLEGRGDVKCNSGPGRLRSLFRGWIREAVRKALAGPGPKAARCGGRSSVQLWRHWRPSPRSLCAHTVPGPSRHVVPSRRQGPPLSRGAQSLAPGSSGDRAVGCHCPYNSQDKARGDLDAGRQEGDPGSSCDNSLTSARRARQLFALKPSEMKVPAICSAARTFHLCMCEA